MQKLKPKKLNLLKLQKEGFSGIGPFSYQSWDTLLDKKVHALGVYGENKPIFKTFPPPQTVAPNPNSLIYEHLPTYRNIYPPGASIQRSSEVAFIDTPFSTPLDLLQLKGLLCTFNDVTIQTEVIMLEAFEVSLNFLDWEQSAYGPKLKMKENFY